MKNESCETVGWAREADDGVILNLAPLHDLMPALKEPEKFWQAQEAGEYDWSRTAMRYWAKRVLENAKEQVLRHSPRADGSVRGTRPNCKKLLNIAEKSKLGKFYGNT